MKILKESFFTLASKVYAIAIEDIPVQCDYGVQLEPEPSILTNIASTIIVPIILLVGLIVFLVKSTSSMAKKVIVSIGTIVGYIVFKIIINFIIDLM